MNRYPTVLADASRIRQFSILAYQNVFRHPRIERDCTGRAWLLAPEQETLFGISVLGGGRHFDAAARELWSHEHASRVEEVRRMTVSEEEAELERLRIKFRFGPRSERMVWAIHLELMRQRQSSVIISETWLCKQVWPNNRPANWRTELSELLTGLSILHISDSPRDSVASFGDATSMLTDFQLRRRGDSSGCPEQCIEHGGEPHGHVRITAGRAFLGCLERLHEGTGTSGKRVYSVVSLSDKSDERRRKERLLRGIGKDGNLTSLFVPSKLGNPRDIQRFTPSQQRLLQVLYRERTRSSDKNHEPIADSEQIVGGFVPPIAANRRKLPAPWIPCPLLDSVSVYCGFNGNGYRKGRGYRLATWLQKSRYKTSREFLVDLQILTTELHLIVAVLAPRSRQGDASWLNLDEIMSLAMSRPRVADMYHLRVYVRDDFMERWCNQFGWETHELDSEPEPRESLRALMESHQLTQRELAKALQIDPSAFSKMLSGKRRLPPDSVLLAQQWISDTHDLDGGAARLACEATELGELVAK